MSELYEKQAPETIDIDPLVGRTTVEIVVSQALVDPADASKGTIGPQALIHLVDGETVVLSLADLLGSQAAADAFLTRWRGALRSALAARGFVAKV